MTKPTIIVTITKGSKTFDIDRKWAVITSGKTQSFETSNYVMAEGEVKCAKVLIGGHSNQVDLVGPNAGSNSWKVK